MKWVAATALGLVLSGPVFAGDTILRGDTPAWVKPIEPPAASAETAEGVYRFQLLDQQYRFDGEKGRTFFRYRGSALAPQGLQVIGAIALSWSPTVQDLIVHHVTITRNGQEIDVLKDQAFEVLRREQRLETAMLDGALTATLQPAGLRVGDELDVAYSIVTNDTVLGAHAEDIMSGLVGVEIERLHASASWPTGADVQVRATEGWTLAPLRRRDGFTLAEIEMQNVQPLEIPSDAPARFGRARHLEVTDYRDWSDLSRIMAPLYARAETLEADSPLKAEIARIAALSDDPRVRAAAALRLVQDQVRYLALNMGDAGLNPATADETWRRRFGDCKGKTALLLALLHGLGIEAVPAAVSTTGGDGLDQRLPMVGALDHVLVRTAIDGVIYWLDGARSGDRDLAMIAPAPYSWALPLTQAGTGLQAIPSPPLDHPTMEQLIDIDASNGVYAPALMKGEMAMNGAMAVMLNGQLAALPASQQDQSLRALWRSQLSELDIETVDARFDLEAARLTISAKGKLTLDWSGDGARAPRSSLFYSSGGERTDGPYKSVPYVLEHPSFLHQTVAITLPGDGEGFTVAEASADLDAGGYAYHRSVVRRDGAVVIDTSVRSLTSEVSPDEAERAGKLVEERFGTAVRIKQPADYEITQQDREAWNANGSDDARTLVDRGLALAASGRRDEAIAMYDRAVAVAPDNANAIANRGIERYWSDDLEGAQADFDKASDIDPSERIAMNGHALLAMKRGEYRDAVIEMSRALRQTPRDKFVLMLRAGAYERLGEIEKAMADIDTAITGAPNDPELQFARVGLLVRAARLDEADAAATALAAADPDNLGLAMTSASIKARMGDPVGAGPIYDRVVAEAPANASYRLARAEFLLDQDRHDEAQADMQAVRDAAGERAVLFNNLCWMQATRGLTLDQAAADCDQALAKQPDEPAFLDSRALVLLQTGKTQEALALYDRLVTLAPQQAASRYGRGLARVLLGQTAEGEADKADALRLSPEVGKSFKVFEARHEATGPAVAQPDL